jgi:hypothetical protein
LAILEFAIGDFRICDWAFHASTERLEALAIKENAASEK